MAGQQSNIRTTSMSMEPPRAPLGPPWPARRGNRSMILRNGAFTATANGRKTRARPRRFFPTKPPEGTVRWWPPGALRCRLLSGYLWRYCAARSPSSVRPVERTPRHLSLSRLQSVQGLLLLRRQGPSGTQQTGRIDHHLRCQLERLVGPVQRSPPLLAAFHSVEIPAVKRLSNSSLTDFR